MAAALDCDLGLAQIAAAYGKSAKEVRDELDGAAKLKVDAGEVPSEEHLYVVKGGPHGTKFSRAFVMDTFEPLETFRGLKGLREVLSAVSTCQGVQRFDPNSRDGAVWGVLASREDAQVAHQRLLNEAVRTGRGVRIRCITGRDLFSSATAVGRFLARRDQRQAGAGRDPIRVQLLRPDGPGAEARLRSEPEVARGMFFGNVRETLAFLRLNRKKVSVVPRWTESAISSALVWCADFALVEQYDYVRPLDDQESGCVGRHAPILVIKGGSAYHERLRIGFDQDHDALSDIARRRHPGAGDPSVCLREMDELDEIVAEKIRALQPDRE